MRTREEVNEFLNSLQWTRTTRDELERKFCEFFDMEEMTFEDSTDDEFKEIDYSFVTTTAMSPTQTRNFVDMEIYYHKRYRQRYFYVSYYTTKKVGGESKIIFGGKPFITSNGLYLNMNDTLNMLAKDADTEDDIVILNIIEFKEEDYHTFDSK